MIYAEAVKRAMKVKKGDIRNTVLRQVHTLQKSMDLLESGKKIKEKELAEFKGEEKGDHLKKQIDIINNGLGHIREAIKELQKYKDVTVT